MPLYYSAPDYTPDGGEPGDPVQIRNGWNVNFVDGDTTTALDKIYYKPDDGGDPVLVWQRLIDPVRIYVETGVVHNTIGDNVSSQELWSSGKSGTIYVPKGTYVISCNFGCGGATFDSQIYSYLNESQVGYFSWNEKSPTTQQVTVHARNESNSIYVQQNAHFYVLPNSSAQEHAYVVVTQID